MMKKTMLFLTLFSTALSTQAHRVWIQTDHTHGGEILKADLGYGEFPTLEQIPEKRLSFFERGVSLYTQNGKQMLIQKGEHNYHFETEKPIDEGSYIVAGEYKPTFWSKNAEGWKQADMKATPNASYCELTAMYGKNIVNVGHESAGINVISKQIGHELEIVPMDNPANINVSDPFKVKVLFRGEPLAGATLTATFDGFDTADNSKTHKVEAQAFSDVTGDDGTVAIIPLRQGFWKAQITHEVPFKDATQCQKAKYYATLTFNIGRQYH
ncbi:putative GH25 family protein [Pasteurella langaaensis DSM 22999]|uniref:Putative GH25 family protein n=1 Tax=Alitibacter langaaensis DSM 22999 TaxID=1122935 RepID=A0A2U0TAH1_9PAST|nr:DUF4198 domain-containing protein [Pasteurella langaaensis]PVX40621.1 putative GH25 family protein [Pasteurella langaaensis DSM 22999]